MTKDRKEQKVFTEAFIPDIDPHSRLFQCPCCKARLQFKLTVNVFGVYEIPSDGSEPQKHVKPVVDRFEPAERALLETMREKGVLQAFETAVRSTPFNNAKDIERYLLTFLVRAMPIKSPQIAIRQCLPKEESFGHLEMWGLNQVVVVLADGEFRAFLPLPLIRGEKLRSLALDNGSPKVTDGMGVEEWVKTRHGYVTGRGAFFSEMRKRAAGSFDNLNVSS